MDGVEGVITCADVPGEDGFGVFVNDQPVMARGKVRYVGEAVAAVAAEDALIAKRALSAIKVEYEPLPAVFDPDEAMRPARRCCTITRPTTSPSTSRSASAMSRRALPRSDLVVEENYTTQPIEHAYLEPEAGLAYVDHDGVVTIVSPSQNITHHRHMLARIIAKPISKVRFIMSPVGGGFGGKEDMIYQGMLALLAMKTQRPVRLVFTREESIISTAKRHPSRTTLRMGLMRDGRIRAVEMKMICDGGAYGLSTEGVMRKAAILARRALRHSQCAGRHLRHLHQQHAVRRVPFLRRAADAFATESHLDICAERLGLDPFEIRRINAMRDGAHDAYQAEADVGQPHARARCRWRRRPAGKPARRTRAATRAAISARDDMRPPCALGARFAAARQAGSGGVGDGPQARTRDGGMLVRDRPHRDRRSRRRLGRDRRRRHAPRS